MNRCGNCNAKAEGYYICELCHESSCEICQPYFDAEQSWCQTCQEKESIRRLSEDAFTHKLRQWFTEVHNPVPPLEGMVPYTVCDDVLQYRLDDKDWTKVKFLIPSQAEFAFTAMSQHHEMKTILAQVYNRIRSGDAWFDGSEEDVRLWVRVKELLQ